MCNFIILFFDFDITYKTFWELVLATGKRLRGNALWNKLFKFWRNEYENSRWDQTLIGC
jgi:hypothetical protein